MTAMDESIATVLAESDEPGIVPALDWHEVFADATDDEDWIAYPLVSARRSVALASVAKMGKSLLMLELAAHVATGGSMFGRAVKRRRVLYVDFENDPHGDLRPRLLAMGFGPDDLGDLIYLSFPSLAKFDTRVGGGDLLRQVEHHGVELVVIDTISRAVEGEENSNDTWLDFYRYTGLLLRRAGVAVVRLDHTGKDASKGMRGGSAKSGDVDTIWELTGTANRLVLRCTDHRFPIDDKHLVMQRFTSPLRHVLIEEQQDDAKVKAVLADMERLKIPLNWGRTKVEAKFKDEAVRYSTASITTALRMRKDLFGTGGNSGGDDLFGAASEQVETEQRKDAKTPGNDLFCEQVGDTPEQGVGGDLSSPSPLRGRTGRTPPSGGDS